MISKHEQIWLWVTSSVLVCVATFYIVMHNVYDNGGVFERLETDEIQMIISLLGESENIASLDADSANVAKREVVTKQTGGNISANLFKRATALEYIFSKHEPKLNIGNGDIYNLLVEYSNMSKNTEKNWSKYHELIADIKDRTCKDKDKNCQIEFDKILRKNEFLLKSFASENNQSLMVLAPRLEVSTTSYFWLDSRLLYLEIMLWSIIGVLCNLLYWGTEFIRIGKFNRNEIPVHIAKLLYTPFCAIIIFFSIENIFGDEYGIYHSSVSVIVLSFILGFFSGAAIDFLRRVKEVLLPKSGNTQSAPTMNTAEDNNVEQNTVG